MMIKSNQQSSRMSIKDNHLCGYTKMFSFMLIRLVWSFRSAWQPWHTWRSYKRGLNGTRMYATVPILMTINSLFDYWECVYHMLFLTAVRRSFQRKKFLDLNKKSSSWIWHCDPRTRIALARKIGCVASRRDFMKAMNWNTTSNCYGNLHSAELTNRFNNP